MLAPSTLDVATNDTRPDAVTAPAPRVEPPHWGVVTRLAFRFCFLYFSLYVICTQMLNSLIVLPVGSFPELGTTAAMRAATSWVGSHILRLGAVEPFGDFSPMGVLWASIGAARWYEVFAGVAELTAGILLFVPGLAPAGMTLQRMDDSFVYHVAKIDVNAKTLSLTQAANSGWKAQFAFERPGPEQLILDGDMDGHRIRMKMRLHDRNKFLLVTRGFHWIQEVPFNR